MRAKCTRSREVWAVMNRGREYAPLTSCLRYTHISLLSINAHMFTVHACKPHFKATAIMGMICILLSMIWGRKMEIESNNNFNNRWVVSLATLWFKFNIKACHNSTNVCILSSVKQKLHGHYPLKRGCWWTRLGLELLLASKPHAELYKVSYFHFGITVFLLEAFSFHCSIHPFSQTLSNSELPVLAVIGQDLGYTPDKSPDYGRTLAAPNRKKRQLNSNPRSITWWVYNVEVLYDKGPSNW